MEFNQYMQIIQWYNLFYKVFLWYLLSIIIWDIVSWCLDKPFHVNSQMPNSDLNQRKITYFFKHQNQNK